MKFFVGLHQPSDAQKVNGLSMISVNRIRNRKSDFVVGEWIMDSGAFTEVSTHGHYRHSVDDYARQIKRWSRCGNLVAAIAQDYMCEPFIVEKTGLSIAEHQRLTIQRYDDLIKCDVGGVYIMPVLQGFDPKDYAQHIIDYGDRLVLGMWVGVGSVCKRNGKPGAIKSVLDAILSVRPDLKLHGFGLKTTSLGDGSIRDRIYSADSMAWSFAARKQGRSPNDWREAHKFAHRVNTMHVQTDLFVSQQVDASQ